MTPTPLSVIGGYLGAGKTTLVNALLRGDHARRLAIIVNDFGEIGLDADLIVRHDGDTINLVNGCICCTLGDGLVSVLDDLRQRGDRIDHVVIEASGVSDPARIGDYAHPFGFELRGIVVLADAEQVRTRAADRYVGDSVVTQLRGADLIVMTKTDLVEPARLDEVRTWLAGLAPDTPVIEAVRGNVPIDVVLGEIDAPAVPSALSLARPSEPEDHRPHEIGYDTWSRTIDEPIERRTLDAIIDALPKGVLRAKAIIHFVDDPEHRFVLQVVGRRRSLVRAGGWTTGEPRTSRIVVIGLPGSLDGRRLDDVVAIHATANPTTPGEQTTWNAN